MLRIQIPFNSLTEEWLHSDERIGEFKDYQRGWETKESLEYLFNKYIDQLQNVDPRIYDISYNCSKSYGLSNYITVKIKYPNVDNVQKKYLYDINFRVSDHPMKAHDGINPDNYICLRIKGRTINEIMYNLKKRVKERITKIDNVERLLYPELFIPATKELEPAT